MAKRTAFVHVGLPHGGGSFVPTALARHEEALAEGGLHLPARSADEMFRAAVEIRHDHRAWGLRRRDVEGTWAQICRRAWKATKARGAVYVGHDLLAGAQRDEIALLLDGLAGYDVHVLVTVGRPDARLTLFPDDHDLGRVVERWAAALRTPDRLHVVVTDPADRVRTWASVGEVLGVSTSTLDLPPEPAVPAVQDLGALRLVASESAALATRDDLVEAVERWRKVVATQGYDVHGDLADLLPAEEHPAAARSEPETAAHDRLALATEALDEALAELARLRRHAAELEATNRKLRRKRKQLKHRLADATR